MQYKTEIPFYSILQNWTLFVLYSNIFNNKTLFYSILLVSTPLFVYFWIVCIHITAYFGLFWYMCWPRIFTESAPRPIPSISCNVCPLFVCGLLQWDPKMQVLETYSQKSEMLKLQKIQNKKATFCVLNLSSSEFGVLANQPTLHSGGVSRLLALVSCVTCKVTDDLWQVTHKTWNMT